MDNEKTQARRFISYEREKRKNLKKRVATMPNTSTAIKIFIVFFLITFPIVCASQQLPGVKIQPACSNNNSETGPISKIKYKNVQYDLKYNPSCKEIALSKNGKSHVIERIPSHYDPEIVGMSNDVEFLPINLQPYLKQNKILYISARRSSAGDGMGECGSGLEKMLNVVDIENSPKIISRILISSCNNNIELVGSEMKEKNYGAFSADGGKLHINFIFYSDQDKTNSVLRDDLKGIVFP